MQQFRGRQLIGATPFCRRPQWSLMAKPAMGTGSFTTGGLTTGSMRAGGRFIGQRTNRDFRFLGCLGRHVEGRFLRIRSLAFGKQWAAWQKPPRYADGYRRPRHLPACAGDSPNRHPVPIVYRPAAPFVPLPLARALAIACARRSLRAGLPHRQARLNRRNGAREPAQQQRGFKRSRKIERHHRNCRGDYGRAGQVKARGQQIGQHQAY